jgi:MFS family permease
MTQDLKFSDSVFGLGAGIFFVGYFLLEIPGTLIVERWSARKWIARIMISWGIMAILMGFIHTSRQFYIIRFCLGLAEAGFFPGIIVYLSHWYRYEDRAKAVALFMSALPISNLIGSPLSGWILGVNWLGMAGWRWVFILEGIPAVIFGLINSVGNLGGFLGPHLVGYLSTATGSFKGGLAILACFLLTAGLLASTIKVPRKKGV